MGYSVLDMLYHLDVSLLEVFFVYIVKMSQNEKFSLSAHIPSLQLVTGLPDSNKGGTKGHVLVYGPWNGLCEGTSRECHPRCSLKIPSRICSYDLCSSLVVVSHELITNISICVVEVRTGGVNLWSGWRNPLLLNSTSSLKYPYPSRTTKFFLRTRTSRWWSRSPGHSSSPYSPVWLPGP